KVLLSDSPTIERLPAEEGDFGGVLRIVLAEARPESDRLSGLLAAARPAIVLTWLEEELADVLEESAALPRGRDEPLYLVHSSGTTGFPKAVTLRNGAQSHAVRGWLCYVLVSPRRDRAYLAVPNNHQAVILTFNSSLLLGLRVHWTGPYDREGFDAERVVTELARGGYTGFFGFPITYTQLCAVDLEGRGLARMRFWASTADASHETVQRHVVAVGGAFRELGLPLAGSIYLDAQGSSEVGTPSVLRYVIPFTKKFGRRIGKPGSTPFGPQIRIARDGTPVARGEVGRLEVRGKTVFNAYWNDPELTALAIRDGWFFTGDVARQGRDGHLRQLDREVDVIHTKEGPVYSLPIEEKLHKHPAVFDLCVYADVVPDGTARPAVAVALKHGVETSPPLLKEEFDRLLDPAEHLHRVDILPWAEFPIGVTGKTLKRVFRERSRRAFETAQQKRTAR
ncbi:MAG TPA: long-chain fatty acid--CoA ligase, partial [Thermoanaerobaculia bacterium]|nr:long-chain fatty acid--CoA ligase [Thermoanaerobaculia bacterium]